MHTWGLYIVTRPIKSIKLDTLQKKKEEKKRKLVPGCTGDKTFQPRKDLK
jgi:hypothetical protein